MELKKFEEFWEIWSQKWLETTIIELEDSNNINVSEICRLNDKCYTNIYRNYKKIKDLTKKLYFKNPEKKLNRYKRAAVLVYAIEKAEPLICNAGFDSHSLLLKERLAFFVAIGSILQDYPQTMVEELLEKNKTLFDFSSIWKDRDCSDDDFITSIYKDIFFSSIYKNYNVITMANVFSLIIEKCSVLSDSPLFSDGSNHVSFLYTDDTVNKPENQTDKKYIFQYFQYTDDTVNKQENQTDKKYIFQK